MANTKVKLSKEYRIPDSKGGYTVYEVGKEYSIDDATMKNIDSKDIQKDDDSKK
jgi:hypothetical protein